MFDSYILEKIFARKELQDLPLGKQSEIIHAIEEILEQEEMNNVASDVSEPKYDVW